MEDAMILNKSAVDRGLAHATVIKTEVIDLRDERGKNLAFAAEVAGPRDHHVAPVSALGQKLPQNIPSKAGSLAQSRRQVQPQVSRRRWLAQNCMDGKGLPRSMLKHTPELSCEAQQER